MKVDLSALWQTLTKRAAALLADEQNRSGSPGACENAGEKNRVSESRGECAAG